jgi:hypothetical protein
MTIKEYYDLYGPEKIKNKIFYFKHGDSFIVEVIEANENKIKWKWYCLPYSGLYQVSDLDVNEYKIYNGKKYYFKNASDSLINNMSTAYIIDDKKEVKLIMTADLQETLLQTGFFQELEKLGIIIQ